MTGPDRVAEAFKAMPREGFLPEAERASAALRVRSLVDSY
jgi:protein-L-isoaspartate O-methyltransferase